MNEEQRTDGREPQTGQPVTSANLDDLGTVDALGPTHIRAGPVGGGAAGMYLWIPRTMIASVAADGVRLNVNRADLHDAVYEMSPGEQREYATLGLHVKLGRTRGLAL